MSASLHDVADAAMVRARLRVSNAEAWIAMLARSPGFSRTDYLRAKEALREAREQLRETYAGGLVGVGVEGGRTS